MHRNFRKPLIVAAPKIGLKHPRAVSNINDMAIGTKFRPIINETYGSGKVSKVIICSGKVGFDIQAKLENA